LERVEKGEHGLLAARRISVLELSAEALAAPVATAHRAVVGIGGERAVAELAGGVAVEREVELAGPVEVGAGAGHLVVPVAGAGDAAGGGAGVGGDFVGDAAELDVLELGRPTCCLGVT